MSLASKPIFNIRYLHRHKSNKIATTRNHGAAFLKLHKKMIIACEPQCIGLEHVQVNAALLTVIQGAFPDEEILFLAEAEHLRQVRTTLESNSIEIKYETIEVPPRVQSNIMRLPREMRVCSKTYALARACRAKRIFFCSITTATLLSIKVIERLHTNIECVVILHEILEQVKWRPSHVPTKTLFWFRFWIEFCNSDRLRFLVLSQVIQEELSREIPRIAKYSRSIELPYFYKQEKAASLTDDDIKFAFIGVAKKSKGADLFFEMAEDVQACGGDSKSHFILIGHIADDFTHAIPPSVYVPSPWAHLNREEFEAFLDSVHYVILLHQHSSYTLKTSAALFDAFSNVKPIIALRLPLFEYYFNKMGDIGYLCESYDDMKNVILEILETRPTKRYLRQCNNILDGRVQFDIPHLSKKLAELWEEN